MSAFAYSIQSEHHLEFHCLCVHTSWTIPVCVLPSSDAPFSSLPLPPPPPPSPSQIPSGEYTGFIKVQLELRRPVTVRGGPGPEAGEEAFYLPAGSTNTLHISSESTVKQVTVKGGGLNQPVLRLSRRLEDLVESWVRFPLFFVSLHLPSDPGALSRSCL